LSHHRQVKFSRAESMLRCIDRPTSNLPTCFPLFVTMYPFFYFSGSTPLCFNGHFRDNVT
jgi:hypothetical protein